MAWLVALSLIGAFYAYLGYPCLLAFLNAFRADRRRELDLAESLPSLTVIIAARNEERVIRAKLEETLALSYNGRPAAESVEVIVASDASDDSTHAIVEDFASRGVKLVALPERGGKEKAQKAAVGAATGELIVFTDAKIRLRNDALENFALYFRDPSVGAVSSVDRIEQSAGGGSGEGCYIKYEMWLRRLESDFGTLVGLSGSCFAVRRDVAKQLRTDIPSDFALLLAARKLGLRGVHGPNIIASYNAVSTEREEFARKVRTVLRGITTLMTCKEVMNPFLYGTFSWQVTSHKLFRWLVPWFLIVACTGSLWLAADSGIFFFLASLMAVFGLLGLLGYTSATYREHPLCKIPLFFIVVNAAIFVAWVKYWRGERTVAWTPSAKAG